MSHLRAPAARADRREGGRHGRPAARTTPTLHETHIRPQLLRLAVLPPIAVALSACAAVLFTVRTSAVRPAATLWIVLGGATAVALAGIVIAAVAANRAARAVQDRISVLRRTSARGQADLTAVVEALRRGEAPPADRPRVRPAADADDFDLLADDLARAHDGAVGAVVQASRLSGHVGSEQKVEVFVNLARRLQSLVHREISILDELENEIEDPDLLKGLFHVDHLATRIRRHAENLAVLGGAVSRRQWSNPVSMTEVLRSATAEVEQYSRVKLVPPIDGTVRGHAVADVIHLLAELVENATVFSAPHTQVLLRANAVTSGLAIEVEDRGLGMPLAEQHRMNALLADPDQVNVASLLQDGRIGLFVVSQLARRHGVTVRLQTNIYGGVQAVLVVPQALLGAQDGQRAGIAGAAAGARGGAALPPGALPSGAVPPGGVSPGAAVALPSLSPSPAPGSGRGPGGGVGAGGGPATRAGSGSSGRPPAGTDRSRAPDRSAGSDRSAGPDQFTGSGRSVESGRSAGDGSGRGAVAQGTSARGALTRGAAERGAGDHGVPTHGVPTRDGSVSHGSAAHGTSLHGMPAGYDGPTHGTPKQGTPAHGTPAHGTPPHGTPAHGVPARGVQAQGAPPHGAPIPAQGGATGTSPVGVRRATPLDSTAQESHDLSDARARLSAANGAGPAPLPVRGAESRHNPAEAVPGIRADDRRLVAENTVTPPTPRNGAVRGTMARPHLPKRRAQEHIVPELRDAPAPRPDPGPPVGHDPGLMAAFQRGIGLAEEQARAHEQAQEQARAQHWDTGSLGVLPSDATPIRPTAPPGSTGSPMGEPHTAQASPEAQAARESAPASGHEPTDRHDGSTPAG
ncbi:sensor histidine kinase [Streptomyces fructofermentans]|uniref:histidine kinase n=1 Tax=Streptomyces fructofermentans TaxID=152141 RepID=A0A918K376_9ACTN|nr:ATP-binding protein [Streptomyces fructofermentans]GGX43432.1 hypothetical protein GCM10010515_07850 [Streptomyces fructofermentans]